MKIEARKVAKKGDLLGGHNIKMTIGKDVIFEHLEKVGKNEYCVWYRDMVAINGKTTLEIARQYAAWMLWSALAKVRKNENSRMFKIENPVYSDVNAVIRVIDNEKRIGVNFYWSSSCGTFSVLSHNGEWRQFDTFSQKNTMQDVANYVGLLINS